MRSKSGGLESKDISQENIHLNSQPLLSSEALLLHPAQIIKLSKDKQSDDIACTHTPHLNWKGCDLSAVAEHDVLASHAKTAEKHP